RDEARGATARPLEVVAALRLVPVDDLLAVVVERRAQQVRRQEGRRQRERDVERALAGGEEGVADLPGPAELLQGLVGDRQMIAVDRRRDVAAAPLDDERRQVALVEAVDEAVRLENLLEVVEGDLVGL